MDRQVDILIIGAGISGIGIAAHLVQSCPQRQFAILESRTCIGGTWDLFRYPGIRSDSDMSTFGYRFKPWRKSSVLADAAAIRDYLTEVVEEFQLKDKIHFGHRIMSANYDSTIRQWVVEIDDGAQNKQVWRANFVLSCTGYYDYAQGFMPDYPNQQAFQGHLIHPQHWPENLDYRGQKVVVIGSGATAITLVPAMAKAGAQHVTMLQRSPTYIASIPAVDKIYQKIRRWMSDDAAYKFIRTRNIAMQRAVYILAQKQPKLLRYWLLKSVERQLPAHVDIRHFSPDYAPWDQRLCVVPDGDLFQVLQSGLASVVTDQIECLTTRGIRLKSGQQLEADLIVSATGLKIQMMGGIRVTVDGKSVNTSEHMLYNGMMLNDVPNMAIIMGYINASWTLKVDIVADYLCRLFNYMDRQGYKEVMARADRAEMLQETVMGSLDAGYIRRAADIMPKQGKCAPWRVSNNYLLDRKVLKRSQFKNEELVFH